MSDDKFIIPGVIGVWRQRKREGASPFCYIVHIRNATKGFNSKEELLSFVDWNTASPPGAALREWLDQFNDTTFKQQADQEAQLPAADGWGPEAHPPEADLAPAQS